MIRTILVGAALVALLAGCGTQTTAPQMPAAEIHSVKDGPDPVPPVKAENYLAPEPDDVELGPRG